MVDAATKQLSSMNGGTLVTDLKGLPSLFKTRKSVAFVYGFMFAFVAFTAFLAFNSSPNSYAPWFTNIFSITTTTTNTTAPTGPGGSHFNSTFSYVYHNTTPLQNATTTSSRSKNTPSSNSFVPNKETFGTANNSTHNRGLQPNVTTQPSIVNNELATANNYTKSRDSSSKAQPLKSNQTTMEAPKTQLTVNQSVNFPPKSGASGPVLKGIPSQAKKEVKAKYTASLSKKQANGTKQSEGTNSGKQGIEGLIQNLVNCDLFDGEWVIDDSYPLYKPGSCSLIDEQFNCILNGRPDKQYQKYKWKPKGCILPRLNAAQMLEMLRGKRLVFVGDSLNRNMWESLVCILRGAAKDQRNVFEANGRLHFRGEASYSFIFKDYNFTVEFFVCPFLVQEWELTDKNGTKKETLRLDLVGRSSDQYKGADIIVFNTGHWWTHEKTSRGKDYYQEGSHVYDELNVLEAFRKAMTTWARWVDANINPLKSLVFFRGYSASHFSGGQWNSGGACDSEVEPIKNATFLREYPPKMMVLERVFRGMKTHVTYLNVTQMTDYRKDGHPSIYRKQYVSEAERRSPLLYQDCSHWCLPGVPDAWNEILYVELLINEKRKHQAQKRHR
uniref:Protein trichome birefringence-like n=1 Tax=Rhizophora mucronata TaxID=61149 RepID=A0A2P2JTA6_RHIMU